MCQNFDTPALASVFIDYSYANYIFYMGESYLILFLLRFGNCYCSINNIFLGKSIFLINISYEIYSSFDLNAMLRSYICYCISIIYSNMIYFNKPCVVHVKSPIWLIVSMAAI